MPTRSCWPRTEEPRRASRPRPTQPGRRRAARFWMAIDSDARAAPARRTLSRTTGSATPSGAPPGSAGEKSASAPWSARRADPAAAATTSAAPVSWARRAPIAGASSSPRTRLRPAIGQARRTSTCSRSLLKSLRSTRPARTGKTQRRKPPIPASAPAAGAPPRAATAVSTAVAARSSQPKVASGVRPRSIRFFQAITISGRPTAARRNGWRVRARSPGSSRRRPAPRASSRRARSTAASSKEARERITHSACAATRSSRRGSVRHGETSEGTNGEAIHREGVSRRPRRPPWAARTKAGNPEPAAADCQASRAAQRTAAQPAAATAMARPRRRAAAAGGSSARRAFHRLTAVRWRSTRVRRAHRATNCGSVWPVAA